MDGRDKNTAVARRSSHSLIRERGFMSDKERQKKDGQRQDKQNTVMREVESDAAKKAEKSRQKGGEKESAGRR
jgi:hypothetical protein